ncbi:MAG: DUF308 domain-containing protein [Cellulosilyticaceae bacterium]
MKNYLDKFFIVDGVLLAIIGALFFINPLGTLISFETVTGILVILVAGSKIFRGWETPLRMYSLLSGIIDIAFGLILIFSPIETIEMMLVVYGAWSLVRGLYSLLLGMKAKTFGWNIKSLGTIVAIGMGLFIILCPLVLLFIVPYVPYVIGAYFLFLAMSELYIGSKMV